MDPIVFQAGAGVSLIALFVFLIVGRKSWKLFHSFCLFLVFCGVWTFLAYAALVVKTHLAWKQLVQKLEADVKQAQIDHDLKIDGDLLDVRSPWDQDDSELSLTAAKIELRRQRDYRGRVWRGCTVGVGGPPVTVTMAAAAGGAASTHNIKENEKLVMFKEGFDPTISNTFKVTVGYLGEYKVTGVTGTTVDLAPTVPLDANQQANLNAIGGSGETISLYERMPLDFHGVFDGLDRAQIEAIIPKPAVMTDEEYKQAIDSYVYDGQKLTDINEPGFDPPPELQRSLIKFNALPEGSPRPDADDDTVVFTVPVNGNTSAGVAFADDAYDNLGLALYNSLLHRDPKTGALSEAKFRQDDEGWFDAETAEEITQSGVGTLQYTVFWRDLIDFEVNFHQIELDKLLLDDAIADMQKQIEEIRQAEQVVQAQITKLQVEVTKLNEDLTNHRDEKDKAAAYRNKLEGDWKVLYDEIVKLWRENNKYEAYLASMHEKLNDQIKSRTDEATRRAEGTGAE